MKKVLMALSVFVFLFAMTPIASAQTNEELVAVMVGEANEKINNEVVKAQDNADLLIVEFEAAIAANPENKTELEAEFNAELDQVITKLLVKTEEISAKTIAKAADYGIEVVCEYVEVEVGGRTVEVDPLHVHSD